MREDPRVVGILAGDHVSPLPLGGDPTANKAAIFLVRVVKHLGRIHRKKPLRIGYAGDVRPAKGVAGGQGNRRGPTAGAAEEAHAQ